VTILEYFGIFIVYPIRASRIFQQSFVSQLLDFFYHLHRIFLEDFFEVMLMEMVQMQASPILAFVP
jgi:hypothetical protein